MDEDLGAPPAGAIAIADLCRAHALRFTWDEAGAPVHRPSGDPDLEPWEADPAIGRPSFRPRCAISKPPNRRLAASTAEGPSLLPHGDGEDDFARGARCMRASAHGTGSGDARFHRRRQQCRLRFSCRRAGAFRVEGRFHALSSRWRSDEKAPGETRTVVKIDAASLTTDHTSWIEDLKGPDFFGRPRYPIRLHVLHGGGRSAPGVLSIPGRKLDAARRDVIARQPTGLIPAPEQTGTGCSTMKAAAELDRTAFGMDA